VSKSHSNLLTYKSKNRWCSVDAHFQNGAVTCFLFYLWRLPIIDNSVQTSFHLTYLHVQKLLTLCGHSFSELGCCCVVFCFASKGTQCDDYGWQRASRVPITILTSPTIVHTLLTLILRTGLLLCGFPFSLWTLPIRWLYIIASKSLTKWLTNMFTNRWHSMDVYFQHRVVNVSFCSLPIKAANMFVMYNNIQTASYSTYILDQQSLTVWWCPWSAWSCYHNALSLILNRCQDVCYA
jgi:hypothetical protein